MSRRAILRAGQHSNTAAREMLSLVFAAELLDPPSDFWIAMAWVSDVSLYDSLHNEFELLVPHSGPGRVYLSDVLTELAQRGSTVNIVTRPDPTNVRFLEGFRRKTELGRVQDHVRVGFSEDIHQKNLVGKDWFTDGSMNLTVNGLDHNVENLTITFDSGKTAEMRNNLRQTWGSILKELDDLG